MVLPFRNEQNEKIMKKINNTLTVLTQMVFLIQIIYELFKQRYQPRKFARAYASAN
jgi:hypothetical protein